MAIERDRFHDAEALHHDEAERVAERVCLVAMVSHEVDGSLFITRADSLDAHAECPEPVEKRDASRVRTSRGVYVSVTTAFVVTKPPSFARRTLEEGASTLVVAIVSREECEEAASIHKDTLHVSSSYAAARCAYLLPETSRTPA